MAQTMTEERGQSDRDINKGWRIQPEDFERNYNPTQFRKATYLLYEIHWGKSLKTWKNWCRNDHRDHAEINFFEKDCEEIKRRRTMPCYITWFLSWSPCDKCSSSIITFLKEQPHVILDIRVCRLFRDFEEQNKTGLRNLADHGVHISIMHLGDYNYCWRSFVAHQRNQNKDFRDFFPKICTLNDELRSILDRP